MSTLSFVNAAAGIPPTFRWPVSFCISSTVVTYVLSLVTGNVSQVDRVWTFLPTIYTAYYALLPVWPPGAPPALLPLFPYAPADVDHRLLTALNPRAVLMLCLQVTWMCRLSYNTWRRGLFSFKDEDYRWEILRQKLPTWMFQVFNLTFIAITQNILLFLIAVPTHNAAVQTYGARAALGTSDYVLGALSVLVLCGEFVADNQQFAFQAFKRTGVRAPAVEWPGARIAWTRADAQRGFITRGLWAWSRHPNFFCEQSFWVLQTLVPLAASGRTLADPLPLAQLSPAIALCALFISSTLFTEGITASKYPLAYAAYKRRVAMFIPIFTPLRGLMLNATGERPHVDRLVWGAEKDE